MGGGKERRGTAEGTHVHIVIIPRVYESTYYRGKIEAMELIPYSVVIRFSLLIPEPPVSHHGSHYVHVAGTTLWYKP